METCLKTDQGATFSRDRVHRYLLWRRLRAGESPCLFILLNPSTADETNNDPTIRRCIGFATDWGHDRLIIANLFGYRATFPADLKAAADPVGPGNTRFILKAARYVTAQGGPVVLSWGVHGAFMDHNQRVLKALGRAGVTPLCLATTKEGHPKHALYLKKDLRPVPYSAK